MDLNLKCIDAFKCIFRSEFCEYKNQFLNAYTLWILHTKYVHIIWHTWCDKTKVRQLVKLFNFPNGVQRISLNKKIRSNKGKVVKKFYCKVLAYAASITFSDISLYLRQYIAKWKYSRMADDKNIQHHVHVLAFE